MIDLFCLCVFKVLSSLTGLVVFIVICTGYIIIRCSVSDWNTFRLFKPVHIIYLIELYYYIGYARGV